MTIYLDADCVLDALVKANFIKNENWKQENSNIYNVKFYHVSTNGTLCFQIYADNNVHRISALYIKNLEKLYGVDLSVISSKCKL
jgi:hypothetical protein